MSGKNVYSKRPFTLAERLDRQDEAFNKKTKRIEEGKRDDAIYEAPLNYLKGGWPGEHLLTYARNIRDFKAEGASNPSNAISDAQLASTVKSAVKKFLDEGMRPNENFVHGFRKGFDPRFGKTHLASKEAFLDAVMDKVRKVGEIKSNAATIKTSRKNLIEDTGLSKPSLVKRTEEWEKEGYLKITRNKNRPGGSGYNSYTFFLKGVFAFPFGWLGYLLWSGKHGGVRQSPRVI